MSERDRDLLVELDAASFRPADIGIQSGACLLYTSDAADD